MFCSKRGYSKNVSCGAGILKCRPRVLPVERGDFAATMSRGLSRNIPRELFQNPSFLERGAVFKCQDAPELFTLKFGQKVVPEY